MTITYRKNNLWVLYGKIAWIMAKNKIIWRTNPIERIPMPIGKRMR
jgi:hypothetical protein